MSPEYAPLDLAEALERSFAEPRAYVVNLSYMVFLPRVFTDTHDVSFAYVLGLFCLCIRPLLPMH